MKYGLQAGRCVTRDGVPFVTIHGCAHPVTGEGFSPEEWDDFARLAANAPGLRDILADVALQATQARLASTIGKQMKSGQRQADFLRRALERITAAADAALAATNRGRPCASK